MMSSASNFSREPEAAQRGERKGKITVPFLTSVFLHGGILVLLGGAVLVPGIIPKAPFVGEMVVPSALEAPDDAPIDDFLTEDVGPELPPSEMPDEAPAAASNPAEQTYDVIAMTSAPSSTFSLPVGSGVIGVGTSAFGVPGGTGTGTGGGRPGRGMKTFFGSSEVIDGGLKGTFYDLKRLRNGSSAPGGFTEKVREFTDGGWRANILNKYYRVSKPMYATQFYIPRMRAEEAPKAFEVENEVQPSNWVIHYTGQFSPPSTGRFRLVGYADDVIIVRVNNRVVLNGSRISSRDCVNWTPGPDAGAKFSIASSESPPQGGLFAGDWMELERGTNYSIDVLLGENPGGFFEAYLFVEQEGRKYKTVEHTGRPILPLFRTAREGMKVEMKQEHETPAFDGSNAAPVFAPVVR